MQPIRRLEAAVQNYDWGSRTVLAKLQDRPPSERPEAELWLGAHPNGQAQVLTTEGERVPLAAWVERDPRGVLGDAVFARFGARFPFLFKILAVERALSLQAHPDAEQARAGYARDRRDAGATGARLYADEHAKPELVVAHTPFRALCGFRSLEAIRAGFVRMDLGDLAPAAEGAETEWLRAFFARWFAPDGAELRAPRLQRAIAAAERVAAEDPSAELLLQLAAQHPGDPGILAPLLLHAIELAPGEALFLGAGELHCYLGGVAAEIMSSSDNVLRAGLTTKRRAADELLRVGRFVPRQPAVLRATPHAPGIGVYATPASEFELARVAVAGDRVSIGGERGVEVLLCDEGAIEVTAAASGEPLLLVRGQSCLVPASAGAYHIGGAGRLYRASVPR